VKAVVQSAVALTPVVGYVAKKVAGKLVDTYLSGPKNVKAFREKLQQLFKGKSVVIIVDELDRCRPDYAVAFLEIVKHLFNNDSMTFVFSVNLKALNQVIQKAYGYDKRTANHYFDRFFITRLTLENDTLIPDIIERFLRKEYENSTVINKCRNGSMAVVKYSSQFSNVVTTFLKDHTTRDIMLLLNHLKQMDCITPFYAVVYAMAHRTPDVFDELMREGSDGKQFFDTVASALPALREIQKDDDPQANNHLRYFYVLLILSGLYSALYYRDYILNAGWLCTAHINL